MCRKWRSRGDNCCKNRSSFTGPCWQKNRRTPKYVTKSRELTIVLPTFNACWAISPKRNQSYQQTVERLQHLIHEFPDDPEYRHQLGITYDYWAESMRFGQQAERQYRSALQLQQELAIDHSERACYIFEYARNCNNFGILLKDTGRLEEAEQSLEEARRMLGKLAQQFPNELAYHG